MQASVAGVDLRQRLGRDLEDLELAAARESSSDDEPMGVTDAGVEVDPQSRGGSDAEEDEHKPTGIGILAPPPDSDEGAMPHFQAQVMQCIEAGERGVKLTLWRVLQKWRM